METKLYKYLNLINLNINKDFIHILIKFYNLLFNKNNFINLISRKTTYENGIILHIIDSLTGLYFEWPEKIKLMDLGSGGGLPAIPLKICNPFWGITLTESNGKKAAFLSEAVSALCLDNVNINNEYFNNNTKILENFDLITSRGFSSLYETIPLVSRYLNSGGLFLAYKGPKGPVELNYSKFILTKFGLKLISTKQLILPVLNSIRILYLFKKI
jgi:16S rRNA (guanine527-N7)-methyltransferase